MQIHEVTQPGMFKTMWQDFKGAVKDPIDKARAVMNTPGAMTTARGYGAALDSVEQARAQQYLGQQTQQRAKQFAQAWKQHQKSSGMATSTEKPPPGGMSSGMAASKTGQTLQSLYGPPKGGIGTMPSDDLKEVVDTAANEFVEWADSQLQQPVRGTNQSINMDQVRKDPAVKAQLDKFLQQIQQNSNNTQAVEQYFVTAMTAMQRMATEIRKTQGVTAGRPMTTGDNPLSRIISDEQFNEIKALAKNSKAAAAIKAALGIR